jgi:hypothetical protein
LGHRQRALAYLADGPEQRLQRLVKLGLPWRRVERRLNKGESPTTAPASNSVLIVFLPLIGAVVGGVVGAWANSWYRGWEAQKADDRERESLLRIIDAEVYENMRLLKDMRTDPDISDKYPSRAALSTDVWDQSWSSLSRLLSKDQDHIFALVRHYASVRRIGALLSDPDAPLSAKSKHVRRTKTANIRRDRLKLLSRLANLAYLDGKEIREKGKRYIGDLPDYFLLAERYADADQMEDGDDADTEEASPP